MKLDFDANEFEEVYMQEVEINMSTGCTLPAGQVIVEQSQYVKEHLTPIHPINSKGGRHDRSDPFPFERK